MAVMSVVLAGCVITTAKPEPAPEKTPVSIQNHWLEETLVMTFEKLPAGSGPIVSVEVPPCRIGHISLEPAKYGVAIYKKTAGGTEFIVNWTKEIPSKRQILPAATFVIDVI